MLWKRLLLTLFLTSTPLLAFAQDAARRGTDLTVWSVLSTVIFGLIGIGLCMLGYFAFDKIAGLKLQHELVEDQNVALGIMLAGVFIGIAIVVAAVMVS